MGSAYQLNLNTTFVTQECCECHMAFAMPLDFKNRKLKDKKNFYCPSGMLSIISVRQKKRKK